MRKGRGVGVCTWALYLVHYLKSRNYSDILTSVSKVKEKKASYL